LAGSTLAVCSTHDSTWAIALNPSYALAYANIGEAYDKAGRPQDSLNALDQALQLNPNLQWAAALRDKIRQRLR